jgi:hypothetical protein
VGRERRFAELAADHVAEIINENRVPTNSGAGHRKQSNAAADIADYRTRLTMRFDKAQMKCLSADVGKLRRDQIGRILARNIDEGTADVCRTHLRRVSHAA